MGATYKLEYKLYLSEKPTNQLVECYLNQVNKLILAKDQGQTFDLTPHPKQNFCYGSLEVNQNIEDEWFVVYILFKLSEFDNNLVIEVHSADSDLLLIVAAEYLPSWIESKKSKHRYFIHKGKVHIIPEHINLKDLQNHYESKTVTQSAAEFIRDSNKTTTTLADSHIQQAIQEQLRGLPDREVWLSKKLKQLDDIISGNGDTSFHFSEKLKGKKTLDDVMAMTEEELGISPFSSASSSPAAK